MLRGPDELEDFLVQLLSFDDDDDDNIDRVDLLSDGAYAGFYLSY